MRTSQASNNTPFRISDGRRRFGARLSLVVASVAIALFSVLLVAVAWILSEPRHALPPEQTTLALPAQAHPEFPTGRSESPTPPHAAQPAYRLDVRLEMDHLDAELIVLPNQESVALQAALRPIAGGNAGDREALRTVRWECDAGRIDPAQTPGRALFTPPRTSRVVTLRAIVDADSAASPQIEGSIRVLTPVASRVMAGGWIGGYHIGDYPDPTDPASRRKYSLNSRWYLRHADRYQIPEFFYQVTSDAKSLKIAPNQTLGFWIIDFEWHSLGMPQYIALDLNLVRKVEDLIELMRADGIRVTRFEPLYGFRPPAFNLGELIAHPDTNLKAPLSMHMYGRAVDLMVDEDGDHRLDDLNGDGRIDIHDAAYIMHYVNILDRSYRDSGRLEMVGGAGLYTHNDFVQRTRFLGKQTPYIHIDTRGFLNEDGSLIRWPGLWPDKSAILWGQI